MTCCGQLPFNEQSGSFRRERTFVIVAAKVSKEPIPEALLSCCARSQREKCPVRVKFNAAAQRENRPFTQDAAMINGRVHI